MTDGKGKSIVVVVINRQTAKAQISKGICVFFCLTDPKHLLQTGGMVLLMRVSCKEVIMIRKRRELDEIDTQLINLLQKHGRAQLKELSAEVKLSPPATASRIRQLENEGIIEGYQAQVNPTALGLDTKAFILLEVKPEQKKEFYPYIRRCRNVTECSCVTGEYSMLLEVFFASTMELDQFIGELQHFGRTKTLIVFSTSVEHRGVELPEENPA